MNNNHILHTKTTYRCYEVHAGAISASKYTVPLLKAPSIWLPQNQLLLVILYPRTNRQSNRMVGPVRRSGRRVPRHDPIGPRPQGSANNAAPQGAAVVPHNASEAGLNSQIARTMIEFQVEDGSMDAETQRYYLYELHKLDQTRPDDDSDIPNCC